MVKSEVYIVWKDHTGVEDRRCVMNADGDYIGIDTGNLYSKETHRHSEMLWATIQRVEEDNETGMYHLWEEESVDKKKAFIGCTLQFREAHFWGKIRVYQCIQTGEYYNQNELKIEKYEN